MKSTTKILNSEEITLEDLL